MPHEIAFEKLLDVLENAYNATALDKCKLLIIEAMDRTRLLKSTVTKAAVRRGRKGGNWAAVAVWYCWYNFGRVHKSLRCTPAMAAGIADHIWSVRELLEG